MQGSPVRVFVALGVLALAAVAARADRIDVVARLGAAASGTVAAGGSSEVGFLVTQGTGRALVFSIKPASKASKLVPDVTLLDPDGATVDVAAAGGSVSKAGSAAWSAKLPDVSKTGLWRLLVKGANGSAGDFAVLIKGKDVLKTASSKSTPPTVPVNGHYDLVITAGENVAVTLAAAPVKLSNVKLALQILDSNGNPLDSVPAVVSAKGAMSLKAFRLPTFGNYTFRFSGGTTGGGFTYSLSTAAAKVKGSLPTALPLPSGSNTTDVATDAEPGIVRTLQGSGVPVPGTTLAYRWTQVGGPRVQMTDATTISPSFTPPDVDASLAFQLSVSSNGVSSLPATFDVEVGKRPLGDAGRSQSVAASANVTLDGSRSLSRSSGALKYAWRQMPNDAATVTLTGAGTATPTFVAPSSNVAALHFGLIVDDGRVKSVEDVVLVSVGDPSVPVADAGRSQIVPRMSSCVLSALGSHRASGVLDSGLQWTQVSGPTVTLAGATSPWPSFTAPKVNADLQFKLTVDGNANTTDTTWVHVRAAETNLPPPARGTGPINVPSGSANLSAAATDPDGDTVRFRWGQVGGPAAGAPADPTNAQTTTSIAAGNNAYLFAVHANDGLQYGAPDLVAVRNSGFNAAPIAIAGADRSADSGVAVSLDGSLSARTDGGSGLTYQWTQLTSKDWFDFATSSPSFDATAQKPVVTIPPDVSSLTQTRTVVFQLVVNDGAHSSLPDMVSVTYTKLPANGKPVVTAQISDSNPLLGQTVTLTATATDRDNDPMTYKWTQVAGGTPVTLTNANSLVATFVAPSSGTLNFQFVANDGIDDSVPATTSCTIDQKPTANVVVSPQNGPPGTLVTMNGQSSTDPENKPLTYQWTQISGTTVAGVNPTASIISFTAPSGPVTFQLKVNDGRQFSDAKTASFSANTPPVVTPTGSRGGTTGAAGPAASITAAYGATVTLAANGSGGGGPLSYTWRVVSQSPSTMPAITLSSTTSATPTFTVPLPTSSSGPFGYASPAPSSPGAVPTAVNGPRVLLGVTATDGSQTSSESTVAVYFYASLADTSQTGGSNTVSGIITSNCQSCHSSGASCPISGSGSGLTLTSSTALLNQRGANACAQSGAARLPNLATVGATSSAQSQAYLFWRLTSSAGSLRMPQGSSLSAATVNLIQDWVDQGVQNN